MMFDDSRARLPPEKGGLGYKGAWTTLEGVYKTCDEHKSSMGRSNASPHTVGFMKAKAMEAVKGSQLKVVKGETTVEIGPIEVMTVKP